MKKVSLVVMERERNATLTKLREAGVVHLKNKSVSAGIPIDLLGKQARNRMALGALFRYPVKKGVPEPYISHIPDEADIADHILGLVDQKQLLLEELPPLLSERQRIEAWGNFNPHDFAFLAGCGLKLFLYSFPAGVLDRIRKESKFIVIFRDKYWVKVMALEEKIPDMEAFALPDLSLSEINSQIDSIHLRLAEIETRLTSMAYHRDVIEADNRQIQE